MVGDTKKITKSNDVLTFTRDEVLKWADKRGRIL